MMDRRTFHKLLIAITGTALFPFAKSDGPLAVAPAPEYIKIGKEPYIVEDTDRWSAPLGTYSVVSAIGYVVPEFWAELQEFEQYSSCGGDAEMVNAKIQLANGVDPKDLEMPIMRRVIGNSACKQFNMITKLPELMENGAYETEYMRSIAYFNEVSHKVWTAADDVRLAKMEAICKQMNIDAEAKRG